MLLTTSSSSSTRSSSSAPFSIFPDLPSRMHSAPPPVPASPPSSKTHAFFTSSFAAAAPPPPPPPAKKRDSGGSTASTSSTTSTTDSSSHQPVVSPSTRSIFSSTSPGFHISRIFPSRYTSNSRDSSEAQDVQSSFSVNRLRRKPEFLQLSSEPDAFADSIESTSGYSYNSFSNYGSTYHSRDGLLGLTDGLVSLPTAPRYRYERDRAAPEGDAPLSSASSSTSSSSSHISIRLPTPPPPPLLTPSRHNSEDNSDFTPRPSSYEPAISSFLRPLPEPISKAPSTMSTTSTAATEDSHDHDEVQEAGELHEGDIISSSSSAAYPTSPSSTTFSSSSSGPSLQLVSSLGQGAFSAVWLAEDQSPVPLALTSKKSVRDLKRQASLQSKGGLSRNGSLKSNASRSGSIKGSGWANVSRNSSFRKLKARLKGTKPVGVGKEVLNEHDSVGLDVAGSKTYVDELGLVRPLTPSALTPERLKVHDRQGSSGSLDVNWVPPSLSRNNSANHKSRTASTTSISSSSSSTRLVAVKLTPRRPVPYSPQAQERTRVGFVREVEILRHISHPNITPLFSFFSTPTHHVLVLPYLRGGDLLSLVNDDKAWNGLSEGVLRRIWCEICRGVGWMHSVGLVHRDVKLENVLVTWDGVKGLLEQQQREEGAEVRQDDEKSSIAEAPLCCSPESVGSIHDHHRQRKPQPRKQGRIGVEDLPTPLIKLTDFGLSRFIDIGNGERGQGELLSTRCGSEAYAAPELVMGTSSYTYSSATQGSPPRKGVYDARETDAWACGVVLYALVARQLPFGEGVGVDGVMGAGRASRIGGERAFAGIAGGKQEAERRQWLMRIARGQWEWPPLTTDAMEGEEGEELVGPSLVRCEGAKGVVARLLVRDHRKRARIQDLWDDEWMKGDAVGRAVHEGWLGSKKEVSFESDLRLGAGGNSLGFGAGGEEDEGLVGLGEGDWEPLTGEEDIGDDEGDDIEEIDEDEDEEDEDEDEGWLLDEEGIGSIARQEVV